MLLTTRGHSPGWPRPATRRHPSRTRTTPRRGSASRPRAVGDAVGPQLRRGGRAHARGGEPDGQQRSSLSPNVGHRHVSQAGEGGQSRPPTGRGRWRACTSSAPPPTRRVGLRRRSVSARSCRGPPKIGPYHTLGGRAVRRSPFAMVSCARTQRGSIRCATPASAHLGQDSGCSG